MQIQAAIVGPNPPIVKIIIGNTFDSVNDVTLTNRASPHQQTQVMRNVIIKYFVSRFLSIVPFFTNSDLSNTSVFSSEKIHLDVGFLLCGKLEVIYILCTLPLLSI